MQLGSGIAVALAWQAATALIRPLAWEPPYAAGAALEKAKRQREKKKKNIGEFPSWCSGNESD